MTNSVASLIKPTNLFLTTTVKILGGIVAATFISAAPDISRIAKCRCLDTDAVVSIVSKFLVVCLSGAGVVSRYQHTPADTYTPNGLPGRNLEDLTPNSTLIPPQV